MTKVMPSCNKIVPQWPDYRGPQQLCKRPMYHDGICSGRASIADVPQLRVAAEVTGFSMLGKIADSYEKKRKAEQPKPKPIKRKPTLPKPYLGGDPIPLCAESVRATGCRCVLPHGHWGFHLCEHLTGHIPLNIT